MADIGDGFFALRHCAPSIWSLQAIAISYFSVNLVVTNIFKLVIQLNLSNFKL